MPVSRTVLGVLVLFLLVQAWLWHRQRSDPTYEPLPVTGGPLPSVAVAASASGPQMPLLELLRAREGCSLLVAVDVNCGFCRRMRSGWAERVRAWADSIAMPITLYWMFESDWRFIDEFLNGFDISPTMPVRLLAGRVSAFQTLGVIGTPIFYLVDSAGVLRYGTAGDRLPSARVAAQSCRAGI